MHDYIKLSPVHSSAHLASRAIDEQARLLQSDADPLLENKGNTRLLKASHRDTSPETSSRTLKDWHKQVGLAILVSLLAFAAGRLSSPSSTVSQASDQAAQGSSQVSSSDPAGKMAWQDLLTSAELQSIPDHLSQEVQAIWSDTRISYDPAFMGAYLAEKQREAALWTLLVGNADNDSSGTYSYSERQDLFKALRAAQDGDKLILQSCTLSMEDCFSRSYFFDYDGPEVDVIGPEHLLKWVAFVQPLCGDCLLAAASPVVCDEASAACPTFGGTDRSWKTVAYKRVNVEHKQ